ncbi:YbjQ family protein [Acidithiobacillus ferrivorans]|nr:YbjQ family protein [Acidithiobacillus ferrivorans]
MAKTVPELTITTANGLPGQRPYVNLGLVMGTSVRSRSQMGNFFSKLKSIGGGKIGGYENLVRAARDDALADIKERAASLQATAIIAFRFDTSSMASGASDVEDYFEVTAYGTAIRALSALEIQDGQF